MSEYLSPKTIVLLGLLALGLVSGAGVAAWVQFGGLADRHNATVAIAPNSNGTTPRQISDPTNLSAFTVASLIYEGLLTYDTQGNLRPGVAEEVPAPQDDGLRYTFRIRHDAKWSDGEPVTAFDFARAAKTFLLGDSPFVKLFNNVEGVEDFIQGGDPNGDLPGLRADSASIFTVTLESPQRNFLHLLTLPHMTPVSESAQFAGSSALPVSNGPYVVESDDDFAISLVANEFYWGGKPRLREIEIELEEGQQERFDSYVAGSLDIAEVRVRPGTLTEETQEQYQSGLEDGTLGLIFNVETPPFDNLRLRQAIAASLDRGELTTTNLETRAAAARGWIPPPAPGHKPELDTIHRHDRADAKRHLNEAKTGGLNLSSSLRFQVEDTDLGRTVGAFVSRQLTVALGILVEVEPVPSETYRTLLREGRLTFSYLYWRSLYLDEASWLYDLFHSQGAFNFTGYNNPEVDSKLDEVLVSDDTLESQRLWNEVHEIVLTEAVIVPLAHPRRVAFVRPDIGEVEFGPMDAGLPGSLSLIRESSE